MCQLVVLYFGERKDDDTELLAKLDIKDEVVAGNVVPFRVNKPDDSQPAKETILPPERLAAANLWEAYCIEEADTFVIADRYGNPYFTGKETELLGKLGEVNKHFRGIRKELKKQVEAAKDARDEGNVAEALKTLKEGFEHKLTGYREATAAAKLYDELIESGRAQMKEADAKTLAELSKTYKGTELEPEIEKAMNAAAKGSN